MMGTYLALDLGSAAIPFAYSFSQYSGFSHRFASAFTSIALVAIPFLIWDALFTRAGIWGFNPDYLLGFSFSGLPIEEILFFLCIPFACLFIYDTLSRHTSWTIPERLVRRIAGVTSAGALLLAVMNFDRAYTLASFGLAALTLAMLAWGVLGRFTGPFALVFLFHLFPFFLVNGMLTSLPVVWYNDLENLGLRAGTIPLEDIAYSFSLLFLTITGYEFFESRRAKRVT